MKNDKKINKHAESSRNQGSGIRFHRVFYSKKVFEKKIIL
jgi:hypothetical protein